MTEGREDQADAGDVVEFLLEQHRRVRRLLTDVLETTGQERQYNFDEAREMLARHETGEEMIVHPLTRHVPNGDAVADARMAEENKAKDSLADLEDMDVDSEEFVAGFTRFRQMVLDHAEAEERGEFPLLRRNADPDELVKARDRVKRAEKMAPTHPHPSARTTTANYVVGPFAAMLDRARDALSRS
jgi:hemerythrin superfamily protein